MSFVLGMLALISGVARAQSLPGLSQQPATVVPQGSPLNRELLPSFPPTAPGFEPETPPPAAEFAPGTSVRINSVAVTGSSVYPPGVLSTFTEGLTGPSVPLSRVEQSRQELLAHYRADGYQLTKVSTVIDRAGDLRFVVVEGYIADVKLEGDIGPAGTQVLRFLDRLLEERPIRFATLERFLLLANDIPGVTVRSVLRPSADDPAALTLIAQVTRKAVDGFLAADNRAFRQTGPEQLLAIGTFNSLSQFGEKTELSILHSFNNTQTFGQAATEFFVGGSGLKVRLYGGQGGTNPSGDLRIVGYDGVTKVFGGQVSYPIIRSRQESLLGIAAFDAIESDIHEDITPGVDRRASFDSLRVFRAGADYTIQDLILGGDRTGVNTATGRLSQGIEGLGASRYGDPQAGRAGEHPSFFKFSGEISRTQLLFHPWTDASVSLFGLVAGQVSNTVLPSAEKFFLGGIRYDRGFYSGEVTGDNALTTDVELQLTAPFTVTVGGEPITVEPQYYIFQDWGETWENQRVDPNKRLLSAGGGVRTQITPFVRVEVEGVARVTREPQSTSGLVKPLKAAAVYWRLITQF